MCLGLIFFILSVFLTQIQHFIAGFFPDLFKNTVISSFCATLETFSCFSDT